MAESTSSYDDNNSELVHLCGELRKRERDDTTTPSLSCKRRSPMEMDEQVLPHMYCQEIIIPPLPPLPQQSTPPSLSSYSPLMLGPSTTAAVQDMIIASSSADNFTAVAGTGMTDDNSNTMLSGNNVAGVIPIIHEPPLSTLNFIANNTACKPAELEWLNDDLRQEISQWKPSITNNINSDVAVNGGTILNVERLQEAFASVFWTDRTFYNFYQAHALGQELANMWGFHLKIEGGLTLVCTYGGVDRSNEYQSTVSESKRRNRATPLSACGCGFKIVFRLKPTDEQKAALTAKATKYHDKKITIVQVRHDRCCFTHNGHKLDKASLLVAKKSSGAYSMKKLPKDLTEALVTTVAFSGFGDSRQIRSIMRQFVPDDLPITDSDVANFRNAAHKAYLSGDIELAINKAGGNISKFCGLDGESNIKLGSDEATKRAREILLATIQNSDDTWVVLQYFKNLQSSDPNFVYEVCTDDEGRPVGIWWMTGEMLKAWIRYGDTLYLDSMKRQMNIFHWPYIGPVVLTSEMTVQVVCECIILEESLPAYAFTLNNLFKHGCRRSKETLRIIFGDCLLTDTLLDMIGLSESSTRIFWDHFHLQSFVWPTALGQDLFARIAPHAVTMMNSQSATDFATACESIKRILISYPEKYTYFKEGYMDRPEKFAAYFIDEVPLSLGRRGDTPAEANHSSINKRLGGGGARQLTDQVRLLLERQHEIVTGRLSDDTKHNHTSTVLSRQMKNDPSAQQAIITLSKYAYEKWSEERLRAREYVCNEQNDGCVKIVWPPSGACHEILLGERCNCTTRITMGIQCRHELCMMNGKFIKEWFADRHFQEHALPHDIYVMPAHAITTDSPAHASISTDVPALTDNLASITPTSVGGDNDFSFSNDICDDNATHRPDAGNTTDITTTTGVGDFGIDFGRDVDRGYSATTKMPKVTFNMCLEQAKLTIQSASSDQDRLIALYACLIKLAAIFRKGCSAAELGMSSHEVIVSTTRVMQPCRKNGTSCIPLPLQAQPIPARINTTTTTRGRIRAAVEGPKPTKKKTTACGFCGEDGGHNINGCPRRTDNGRRHHVLCGDEYERVISMLAQGTVAVPLPTEMKSTKKVLDSIPPRTKWLVIKGIYHTLISASGIPPMDSSIVHVDCLGSGGNPLTEDEYSDCLVRMIGAYCWIGKSGKNGTKVLSSIFIDRMTNPSLSESLLQKAQALYTGENNQNECYDSSDDDSKTFKEIREEYEARKRQI